MIIDILSILVVGLILLTGYRVNKIQKVMKKKLFSDLELKRAVLSSGYSNSALLTASLALLGRTYHESGEICILVVSGVFFVVGLITLFFQLRLIIRNLDV
jgi:hypothetical protein